MNPLQTRHAIHLWLGVFIAIASLPVQAQTATWNDGGNDQSWSDPANWNIGGGKIPGVALQPPSPGSAPSTVGYNVVIGTIGSGTSSKGIAVDTAFKISGSDASVTIGNLSFNNTLPVDLYNVNVETLTINGNLTNNAAVSDTLTLPFNEVAATATFAGGPSGGSLNFAEGSTLYVGTSTITTTGTVNVLGSLSFAINASTPGQANTTYGTIGSINTNGAAIQIGGTYAANATLNADTGDFFQLTTGNFAGSIEISTPSFTDMRLNWVTSLYLKGILFVEPTAGGNIINSGVVLPIDNDTEFNNGGIALNGGELLTNNNSSTLDTGGTPGAAFSTPRGIGINTVGGTFAAATGTTATYSGVIANGSGTTGTLTFGDATNNGTVVLTANNTYTQNTVVSSGTLVVTGSTAGGTGVTLTVGNNTAVATLAGTGTINGAVTTVTTGNNVAHISPGATPGTVGTLNIGSQGLTIGNGTNLDFDLNTNTGAGGSNNDLITMNGGTLNLQGTTKVNFNPLSTLTKGTPYTLINGASSISGFNASNFTSTGLGALTAVYSTTATSLQATLFSSQSITFPAISNQLSNAPPFTLSATASSGLAVSYSLVSGPATLSGTNNNTVNLTGTGTVVIQANQAGNGTFAPAPSVQQSFMVLNPVSMSQWATNNGFTAANGFTSSETGPTATPFNDGVPNLLKYLYNINPAVAITANGRAALPTSGSFTSGGVPYITLTFRKYALGTLLFGQNVNVQTSPDLQTWTTLTQSSGSNLTTTIGQYTLVQVGVDSNTGDPIMEVEAPYSSTTNRQFIRLNVSQ